ncbi:MAG TPA: hypothetical protein PLV92_11790, partial [Pirellulaceae bacterium]|nr:hypothetical protein [Pirellulaceae bacterium]
DWTTDPLVSLHFAAVSAMKRLEDDKNRRPTHLAVWSTSIGHLEFANCLNSKCGPHIVHPPRADNPNLTAQRGVFTLCRQKIAMPVKNNQEIDRRPLNEQVAATLSARTSEEKEEFAKRFGWLDYNPPFFIKYTLPIGQAPILYDLLQARGYDSGRLYPGFGGAAQSVMNAATVLRLRLRN